MKVIIEDGYLNVVLRFGTNHSNPKFPKEVTTKFQQRIAQITSAKDTSVLRKIASLYFEKLKGNREDQYSIRINLGWRIIFRVEKDEEKR